MTTQNFCKKLFSLIVMMGLCCGVVCAQESDGESTKAPRIFVQGEASATFSKVKLYTQAGYRLDVMNILTSVSSAKGNAKAGYESKYVPAPYVKAGLSYRIK